jgi:hypothetical protein
MLYMWAGPWEILQVTAFQGCGHCKEGGLSIKEVGTIAQEFPCESRSFMAQNICYLFPHPT